MSTFKALYQVFASYKRPVEIENGDQYLKPEALDTLLTAPLAELSCDDLRPYAANVQYGLVGSLPDFGYFLPRILQLAIIERFNTPEMDDIFKAMAFLGWSDWNQQQKFVVRDLMYKKFGEMAATKPDVASIEFPYWLKAFVAIKESFAPLLVQLTPQKNRQMLEFYFESEIERTTDEPVNRASFCNGIEGKHRAAMLAWLESPEISSFFSEVYAIKQ